MGTYNNMCAVANRAATQKRNSLQGIRPCVAPNGQGYMVTTYALPGGRGTVTARILSPQGAVIGYRVRLPSGIVVTCPPNLTAIGCVYVPGVMAIALGYNPKA
ncbi:MAG: hypothetical protein KAS32_19470 [Candidatus Peribacteraceae bacterium]|nr:hypothetical protein [Candidatus Peribacteraceae bacterium]